ncbi:MAG: right-handed parallel beta-helix repeat-containing protein, partial [Desulfotomaculaceae bacterium]
RNLVIKDNNAGDGAGIYISGGSPVFTDLVIQNNTTSHYGGGIYTGNASSPKITNAVIKGNKSYESGTGLYNDGNSSPVLTNVLFTGNSSGNSGTANAVISRSGYVELRNVTIVDNISTNFGVRALTALPLSGGSIGVYNSIVFGSISDGDISFKQSLLQSSADVSNGNINAIGITEADIFTNPATGDYTLKSNAIAIDAGEEDFYPGLDIATKDLAGNARVYQYSGGGVLDLGAYESSYSAFPYVVLTPDANGIIYVKETATGNKNGSDWANATDNLKRAVRIAGAQQVWVATGTYTANNIALKNNVEIYGGFDPDNGIVNLTHNRILPNPDDNIQGSVINAQNNSSVVWNNNNGLDNTAVLDGFTITNGSNPTAGGGIYNNGASPTLRNLWIKGNTTPNDGGGMFNVNSSSPVMTNVTVSGNTARYGGGIFNRNNSSPVMTNVQIRNNSTSEDGGGMYNDASASPVMTNVSITANSAKNGAGMYNRTNSSPVLTNALIAGNTASSNGGAIRNEASSSSLTNVTIAGNNGSTALYATGAGATTLANSIIYGSVSGTYNAQYSLVQGNVGGTNGNLDGTSILADAVFINAPGGNYTLKATSPVIDKGNNALNATLLDLAGNVRVASAVIDLGAYEFQPVSIIPDGQGIVYVNQQVAGGSAEGTDWANAAPELADALQAAQTNTDIKQIWVAKGTYLPKYRPVTTDSEGNPTSDQDKTFLLVKDVKIYGGFDPENGLVDMDGRDPLAAPTVLSGDLGAPVPETDNVYHVVLSVGDVGTAELNGFTVSGGYAFGGAATLSIHSKNIPRYQGAGLFLVESSPVISGVHIRNNMAMVAGAGLYLSYSNSALTNVRISGNTTFGNGGGMFNGNSSPVLTNVLIDNNNASGRGGGMENGVSDPILTNVTIAYNRTGGGMVNSSGSSPLIRNSILYGNASYNVWNADIGVSQPVFSYSLLQGNGGSDAWDSSGGNVDGGNNIDLDPLFVDAENALVANRDYRLQTGSPAQEAGDNSLYYMGGNPDLFGITTDLAGNPRISGDIIDMGAYEFVQGPPVVITPDAGGIAYVRTLAAGAKDGSSWDDATADLQGAIQSGAIQVFVASGTYQVPAAINGFVMKNGVAIYGGFDPDNGVRVLGDARILPSPALLQGSVLHGLDTKSVIRNEFAVADPLDHTAVLDGFTLTKGRAVDGGGIYNEYASPTLTNLLILDNRATRHGGGMYNSYSSPVMDRMTIQGNTADNQGGGIYTG